MITFNEDVNSALSHPLYNKKYKGLNIQYSRILNYLYVPYELYNVVIMYFNFDIFIKINTKIMKELKVKLVLS